MNHATSQCRSSMRIHDCETRHDSRNNSIDIQTSENISTVDNQTRASVLQNMYESVNLDDIPGNRVVYSQDSRCKFDTYSQDVMGSTPIQANFTSTASSKPVITGLSLAQQKTSFINDCYVSEPQPTPLNNANTSHVTDNINWSNWKRYKSTQMSSDSSENRATLTGIPNAPMPVGALHQIGAKTGFGNGEMEKASTISPLSVKILSKKFMSSPENVSQTQDYELAQRISLKHEKGVISPNTIYDSREDVVEDNMFYSDIQ